MPAKICNQEHKVLTMKKFDRKCRRMCSRGMARSAMIDEPTYLVQGKATRQSVIKRSARTRYNIEAGLRRGYGKLPDVRVRRIYLTNQCMKLTTMVRRDPRNYRTCQNYIVIRNSWVRR